MLCSLIKNRIIYQEDVSPVVAPLHDRIFQILVQIGDKLPFPGIEGVR